MSRYYCPARMPNDKWKRFRARMLHSEAEATDDKWKRFQLRSEHHPFQVTCMIQLNHFWLNLWTLSISGELRGTFFTCCNIKLFILSFCWMWLNLQIRWWRDCMEPFSFVVICSIEISVNGYGPTVNRSNQPNTQAKVMRNLFHLFFWQYWVDIFAHS